MKPACDCPVASHELDAVVAADREWFRAHPRERVMYRAATPYDFPLIETHPAVIEVTPFDWGRMRVAHSFRPLFENLRAKQGPPDHVLLESAAQRR